MGKGDILSSGGQRNPTNVKELIQYRQGQWTSAFHISVENWRSNQTNIHASYEKQISPVICTHIVMTTNGVCGEPQCLTNTEEEGEQEENVFSSLI